METLTAETTFTAKCHNQELVIEFPRPIRDDNNRQVALEPGRSIKFEGHRFVADEEAAQGLGMELGELVAFVRDHELFGVSIWDETGPPDELEPSVKEQAARAARAFASQDADGIQAVIDSERDTHNRAVVIQQATALLEQLADEPASGSVDGSEGPFG